LTFAVGSGLRISWRWVVSSRCFWWFLHSVRMCLTVSRTPHSGGSSLVVRRRWVSEVWPIPRRFTTVSCLLEQSAEWRPWACRRFLISSSFTILSWPISLPQFGSVIFYEFFRVQRKRIPERWWLRVSCAESFATSSAFPSPATVSCDVAGVSNISRYVGRIDRTFEALVIALSESLILRNIYIYISNEIVIWTVRKRLNRTFSYGRAHHRRAREDVQTQRGRKMS